MERKKNNIVSLEVEERKKNDEQKKWRAIHLLWTEDIRSRICIWSACLRTFPHLVYLFSTFSIFVGYFAFVFFVFRLLLLLHSALQLKDSVLMTQNNTFVWKVWIYFENIFADADFCVSFLQINLNENVKFIWFIWMIVSFTRVCIANKTWFYDNKNALRMHFWWFVCVFLSEKILNVCVSNDGLELGREKTKQIQIIDTKRSISLANRAKIFFIHCSLNKMHSRKIMKKKQSNQNEVLLAKYIIVELMRALNQSTYNNTDRLTIIMIIGKNHCWKFI